MIRKIILISIFTFLLIVVAISYFERKLPDFIRDYFEMELGCNVAIGDASFVPPFGFRINDFSILESGEFSGEPSLYLNEISCQISPLQFIKGDLNIKSLKLDNAKLIVRRWKRRFFYPSAALVREDRDSTLQVNIDRGNKKEFLKEKAKRSIFIDQIKITNSELRFIDYDISEDGFAIDIGDISADIRNISDAIETIPIEFFVSGKILQGREHGASQFSADGWSKGITSDMDMNLKIESLWIPHFEPYYRKVTSSRIRSGLTSLRSTTVINNGDWNTNARARIRRLEFDAYEADNRLFGEDAETLVGLLKDRSGELLLDLVLRWDLKDPDLDFRIVLRKSIQRSLKATLLANIKNVFQNTLDRIDEEGVDSIKQNLKDIFQKVRDSSD